MQGPQVGIKWEAPDSQALVLGWQLCMNSLVKLEAVLLMNVAWGRRSLVKSVAEERWVKEGEIQRMAELVLMSLKLSTVASSSTCVPFRWELVWLLLLGKLGFPCRKAAANASSLLKVKGIWDPAGFATFTHLSQGWEDLRSAWNSGTVLLAQHPTQHSPHYPSLFYYCPS